MKINRKLVSNCAYPTKHEENVKIFFLACLSTIFRWILNREHIFAKDAEFIPDGGFAMKFGDAKEIWFSFVTKTQNSGSAEKLRLAKPRPGIAMNIL